MQVGRTSSTLLRKVRANRPDGWQRIVQVYSPLVYYWCREQAGMQEHDAADVVQEVFVAIYRSVSRFDKTDGSFRGWLRVIASNKIRDHYRRSGANRVLLWPVLAHLQHQHVGGLEDWRSDWHAPLDQSEKAILIRSVLESLEPVFDRRSWQAFWQAKVDGRTYEEVARELGISVAAVKQAVYRIVKRLRSELRELGDW